MGTRFTEGIKEIFRDVISIFYDSGGKCILCGDYSENYLCRDCISTVKVTGVSEIIRENDESYRCYSLGFYSYGLKKLLLSFKFRKDFLCGRILASYMAEFIKEDIKENFDFITYIPSSEASMKKRGFNQCEFLAECISKNTGIAIERFLKKSFEVKDQIGLSDRVRWENLRDSFEAAEVKKLAGKKVLIIDDVITTGATAFFSAQVLKGAGAAEVSILTVAKSRV